MKYLAKRQKLNSEKKRSRISAVPFVIAAVLAVLAVFGGVFAKYIYNSAGQTLISSKEFYFTSNMLTESTAKYVLNSTETSASFTVGNNADKLRFSEDDIDFEITVTCNGAASDAAVDISQGTLSGGAVSERIITVSNLKMGETYLVTATGTAGYKQTISAEFTVSDKDENVYKHLDTSNPEYVLLTVWTHNVAGVLNVEFNGAGLIPDATNDTLDDIRNYNGSTYGALDFDIQVTEYSSYTYRFFVDGNGTYTVDDFTAIVTGGGTEYRAREGTPK